MAPLPNSIYKRAARLSSIEIAQLQRDLICICEPFREAITEIYARAIPIYIIRRAGWPEPVYPREILEAVRELERQMSEALESYAARIEQTPYSF